MAELGIFESFRVGGPGGPRGQGPRVPLLLPPHASGDRGARQQPWTSPHPNLTPPLPPRPPPPQVKNQVVTSAVEAAEMILRVDDIIRAAPRQRG
jgi:hypothetical protein